MKSIFVFLGLLIVSLADPSISDVREEYRFAANNQESAENLYNQLSTVTENDNALLVGYKGASATIMARYGKGVSTKTTYFKEGKKLIELAISSAPENIELRYIRLSVQENAPKIVRYRNDISEDKQFILDNFNSLKDAETKRYIKGFVSQSSSFSEAEKELF